MIAGKLLQQLLDYVAHYSSDLKKAPSSLSEAMPCYSAETLKNIEGLTFLDESRWWFKLQRIDLTDQVYFEEVQGIVKKSAETKSIAIDWSRWPAKGKLTPYDHKGYLSVGVLDTNIPYALALLRQCQDYLKYYQARQSKKLYDRLFAWYMNAAEGTQENIEVVAGFGLLNWLLPSGIKHSYPIITLKVELDLAEDGSISIGPAETKPQIELDALMAEEEIQGVVFMRSNLQALAEDGRFLDIFNPNTFSDMLNCVAVGLGSNAKLIQQVEASAISINPQILDTALLFARPFKSCVLTDDIEALKQKLEDDPNNIPEQPLSLVTDLRDLPRDKVNTAYRGLTSTEKGDIVEELYFPLSSNKEQISIIKQLDSSPGVVVQGPPGTGKTHTIANIICHYLANGKKILVTAQQPHVLKTLHEKIPDSIKHLAISRIGNSQDSKRHLEGNIDHIIETLSQLNEFEVENEITAALVEVDRLHSEIAEVDVQIADFAQRNMSFVTIDGFTYKPIQMHDVINQYKGEHTWFKDAPYDGELGNFPLDPNELDDVIKAREQLAGLLPYYSAGMLPDIDQVLTVADFERLSERFNDLDSAKKLIQKSDISLKFGCSASYLSMCLVAIQNWRQSIIRVYEINEMASALLKLFSAGNSMERNLLSELLESNMDLTVCRKNMLKNPVDIPVDVVLGSAVYKAIVRGAEGKSPLPWYAMNSEAAHVLKQINVLGHAVSSQKDWELVLQNLNLQQRMIELASRWNNVAQSVELPRMKGDLKQLLQMFDTVSILKINVERHIREHTSEVKGFMRDTFTSYNFNELDPNSLNFYIEYLQAHKLQNQLETLQKSVDQHLDVLAGIQFYKSDRMLELLQNLRAGLATGATNHEFAEIRKTLVLMKNNQHLFDVVKRCSDRLVASGAPVLAERILKEPCDDMYCELHHCDIFRAWHWKRATVYLSHISDNSVLKSLASRRKMFERQLADCYEELVANKAWLALKRNASEKMLVSLNRYKIAVNKIGKGKGRNADRYRKDAQDALLQISSSIPCWIMSHFQVSETMPATLGMFDLVIVDEASQSSVEAIPVLLRAKKLLIVGDNKQVSPSNVGLSVDQITMLRNKYLAGQPHKQFLTPDMSLYDIGSSIYDSNVMLLEHFRCHPEIIEYSNNNFYSGRIKPMRISKASERFDPPLVSLYVEDGKRESKGNKHINRREAAEIIAEMGRLFEDPFCTGKSIGVVSLLGSAQAEYVQTLALDAFGALKLASVKFACGEASSFQGAEKDIIFLSMVADPENCTPLSRIAHEQRLNVAASRAKERMYLVHSVKIDQLSLKDLRLPLLTHFSGRNEPIDLNMEQLLRICKTEFEKDICAKLFTHGYKVSPQYKIGSNTVDFVVEFDDSRVVIECDGELDEFNSAAWEKQMSKQRDLERAGWVFLRYFASTWYMDSDEAFKSLVSDLGNYGVRPKLES